MAILYWLMTLNSVVNPWIYMFFNVSLVETLWNACRRPWPPAANRPAAANNFRGGGTGRGAEASRAANSAASSAARGRRARQGSPVTAVTEVGGGGYRSGHRAAYLSGGSGGRGRSDTLGSQTSFTVVHTSSTLASNALSSRSLESHEGGGERKFPRALMEQKSTDSVGVTFKAPTTRDKESPEPEQLMV